MKLRKSVVLLLNVTVKHANTNAVLIYDMSDGTRRPSGSYKITIKLSVLSGHQ